MIEIPVSWASYCPSNPARGRWDQNYIARLLAGEEWRPPGAARFTHASWPPKTSTGRVVVFPCGHYFEHGEEHTARWKLQQDLAKLDWAIVIATSDECQTFRWEQIDPWPSRVRLWVMLPRPSHDYPPLTRFIGEGSPTAALDIAHIGCQLSGEPRERDIDLYFSGQGGHERRVAAVSAMRSAVPGVKHRVIQQTSGFTQGDPQGVYYQHLRRTWFAPAPSGICSQSSFRFFEALEAGAIPIADGVRPGLDLDDGYWRLVGLDKITTVVENWRELPAILASQHPKRHSVAAHVSARWQQYKRRVAHNLHDDVCAALPDALSHDEAPAPDDAITVIVPTSPVPSNPSINHIAETVDSVRRRLPNAEILITADGVRDEQLDATDAYDEYLYNLTQWTLTQHNVCPFLHHEHRHQSGMMRDILDEVQTPYVMYVEHDCPLEGDIPFDRILATMDYWDLNLMRFFHEAAIQAGSGHLFLTEMEPMNEDVYVPLARTIQWSQRPHIARTGWYQAIMWTYFGSTSRTMIEDVMHGVVQHGLPPYRADGHAGRAYSWGIRAAEQWEKWRMAVYAPAGSWKRSGHLDARGSHPKFPMLIAYDDGRPEGGPPEGWMG